MSRSGLSAGLGVAVILATASCGGSTASPSTSSVQWSLHTITPGVLTIATYGSAPPLITVGPGANDIGGLSGGWAKAFAADFGLQVRLLQTTFASTLVSVQQGKADIGAPVYYNSDRAKTYYYTYPVDNESLVVFTKKDFSYSAPSSLQGHKVGTVTGYVWTPYFQKFFGSNAELASHARRGRLIFGIHRELLRRESCERAENGRAATSGVFVEVEANLS